MRLIDFDVSQVFLYFFIIIVYLKSCAIYLVTVVADRKLTGQLTVLASNTLLELVISSNGENK